MSKVQIPKGSGLTGWLVLPRPSLASFVGQLGEGLVPTGTSPSRLLRGFRSQPRMQLPGGEGVWGPRAGPVTVLPRSEPLGGFGVTTGETPQVRAGPDSLQARDLRVRPIADLPDA